MSRKHKKLNEQKPIEIYKQQSSSLCTDRGQHWERIIINGYCGKCMKQLAPIAV